MVPWQMILSKDIQDTETHSGPMQGTAVWEQLWGPFSVWSSSCFHTYSPEGREGDACDPKGLWEGTPSIHCPHHLCFDSEAENRLTPWPNLLPDTTKEDFPGVRGFSQTESILPESSYSDPESLSCPGLCPVVMLHGEVNKSPMATAMKNTSPLKTGGPKQLEGENSIFNVNSFGFLVHRRSCRAQLIHVKIWYLPKPARTPGMLLGLAVQAELAEGQRFLNTGLTSPPFLTLKCTTERGRPWLC